MSTNVKRDADASADTSFADTSFNTQVCTNDGRLLREFTLTGNDDRVTSLKAAEHHVRLGLANYKGEPLVVFLSEETLTEFHQVQIKVVPNTSYTVDGQYTSTEEHHVSN